MHSVRTALAPACTLSASGTYAAADTCATGSMCKWKFKCNSDASCTLAADGIYNTQDDCFGSAGKCGWKYACNSATGSCELAPPPGGTFQTQAACDSYKDATLGECGGFAIPAPAAATTLPATADTKYGTPQDLTKQNVWIPLGAPFLASRAYIQVTSGATGTVSFPSATATGSDVVFFNLVVRGFGNVTPGAMDPDSANSIIITGPGNWGFRTTSPSPAFSIYALGGASGGNGNGIATVGKTYQVYLRIYDATDDPIAYTAPAITVAQYSTGTYPPQLCLNAGGPLLVTQAMSTGTAGSEYLVPVTPEFRADKPYIQVRCDASGTVHLPTLTSTGVLAAGTDSATARYVVRGFGNVTPGQPDPDSSNPVIIWGKEVSGSRTTLGFIPALENVTGNGRAVVGKTYRVYLRIWDQTDEDIYVTWPAFTVTQSDAVNYLANAAGQPVALLSSSTGTINLLFNTTYLKVDGTLLGTLYSADGNWKLYMDPATDRLKVVNIATGAATANPSFPASASAWNKNGMLLLTPEGNLVMNNDNWAQTGQSATISKGVAPYKLSIANSGTSVPGALVLSDSAKAIIWSYPAGYTGVPP